LKEKWELIESLRFPRIGILNADDGLLRDKLSNNTGAAFFTFGITHKADFMARRILSKGRKTRFLIKDYLIELKTLSKVNVYNALAAYALARIFGIDARDIMSKFSQFEFPKSRFQLKIINGFTVIDDAYNANPASFYNAIEAFNNLRARGRKIAVIGDMLELGKESKRAHRQIGRALGESAVDLLIGVGKLSHIACDAARTGGLNSKIIHKCRTTGEARSIVSDLLRKGDVVLLKGSRAMRLEEVFK
jgi:UDP-N-acetylmuramoyl-tripeptide--D-alanyl-D-alanine ligase